MVGVTKCFFFFKELIIWVDPIKMSWINENLKQINMELSNKNGFFACYIFNEFLTSEC